MKLASGETMCKYFSKPILLLCNWKSKHRHKKINKINVNITLLIDILMVVVMLHTASVCQLHATQQTKYYSPKSPIPLRPWLKDKQLLSKHKASVWSWSRRIIMDVKIIKYYKLLCMDSRNQQALTYWCISRRINPIHFREKKILK